MLRSTAGVIALLCTFFFLIDVDEAEARRRRGKGFQFHVDPIAGYERTFKLRPTPHHSETFIYGGRLVAGYSAFSLEAEYLRGQGTETFAATSTTTTETADKVKLGLRTHLSKGSLSFLMRAGVQGKRVIYEETVGGATTRVEDPLEYDPYAGAGLYLRFSKRSRTGFFAEIVAVFNDTNDLSRTTYQGTAGFSLFL